MDCRLPATALIDTGVLIRALEKPDDPNTAACVSFCERMVQAGRTIFVAAPTIYEVARHKGLPVPRRDGIVVVPFDQTAGNMLARKLPISALKTCRDENGLPLDYLKYDALIAGCMLRCRAEVLVALDTDHWRLAKQLDYNVKHPGEFPEPQLEPSLLDVLDA